MSEQQSLPALGLGPWELEGTELEPGKGLVPRAESTRWGGG